MKTRQLVLAAMMIAITTALGIINVQFPFINEVRITGQTMGVMLAGVLLGARLGGISMLTFVVLVAAGAPLLSGFRGGIGIFATASGGYVLSWPIAAFLAGYLVERMWNNLTVGKVFLVNVLCGMLLMYLIGVPYQAFISKMPLGLTVLKATLFLPGDLIKSFLAAFIAVRMRRSYPLITLKSRDFHDRAA